MNLRDLIEYSKEGILSKSIIKNSKIDATLFCMAAGSEIDEHTSTKQGIIYVLEGNGIFNLEGKDIKMQENVLIQMNENAVHSLKAFQNTAFLLILIK